MSKPQLHATSTHRRVAMRARLGHVFLSVADDRVLAKAHCSALPLTGSQADAKLLHSFDATNAGRQIGAEKTAVGGFVGEPAHGAETQIDGAGGELTGFEMRAIPQDHDPVEGQARFRTIPVNELIDGVTITPLCVCRVGEKVPEITRAHPSRNNQISDIRNNQTIKHGNAAHLLQTERRMPRTTAPHTGAVCTM